MIGSLQSWQALASELGTIVRVLCPTGNQALRTAKSTWAAAAPPKPASHKKRLLPDGPSLPDFLSSAAAVSSTLAPSAVAGQHAVQHGTGTAAQDSQALAKNIYIETYGCQMNLNDSEIINSVLRSEQYIKAASVQDAGVVLLNTCAIRENAEARIWGRLRELQAIKKHRWRHRGPPLVVGVLGCMAERLKSGLLDQQRLADLVVGPDAYRDLPRIISAVQAGELQGSAAMNVQLSLEETYADIMPVRQDSSCTSAFVSIMRGCNNMCAFCIVPHTRGRERSRPVDTILKEVDMLSEQGVKEVTLLGQNVNSYADLSHLKQQQQQPRLGQQRQQTSLCSNSNASSTSASSSSSCVSGLVYAPGFVSVYKPKRDGAVSFATLLERVAAVNAEMRVRFTSPHPKDFTNDVLQVIASLPNVCNQLHMPAQSGSSSVLARMKRGYTREAYDALVLRTRQAVPNVALSTDIITGFCGETEEEHQATLELLRTIRYDNAFLFSYSERAKTHASRHYSDDVPPEVKSRRLAELFTAYRQGQTELNRLEVGRLHLVLLDGRPRRGGEHALQGRTCSMKRVIIPEQPVPCSLSSLQQHCLGLQTAAGVSAQTQLLLGNSNTSAMPIAATAAAAEAEPEEAEAVPVVLGQHLYQGPNSSVSTGDYVAVLVQQVVGTSTLLSVPLAKTSTQEFIAFLGSTTPGVEQLPGWLPVQWWQQQAAAAAPRDLGGLQAANGEALVAQAGRL